jgi:hypothetical protein
MVFCFFVSAPDVFVDRPAAKPVENKVMDIYQRDEGQKARGKIGVKNAADDPWPGDK